jgi:DNA polymerase
MTDRARQQLRHWLEFYQELGLAPFVRRPAVPTAATPEPASRAPAAAPPRVEQPAPPTAPASALTAPPTLSLFGEAPGRIEGETLPQIRADLGECTRCKLHRGRTHIVFGEGNSRAQLVFVGEAPGADEDAQGRPFVGRAGQLLTRWIEGPLGMKRGDVYICNVLKCRPPGNRSPEKDEVDTCSPFLIRQLDAIRPKLICCLGAVALQELLGKSVSISRLRGQFFDWRGMKMFATFHPAYLLRNPHADVEVRQDLRKIRDFLAS